MSRATHTGRVRIAQWWTTLKLRRTKHHWIDSDGRKYRPECGHEVAAGGRCGMDNLLDVASIKAIR